MKYIFLTYVNRSGSTFFANQISKSEDICMCPEANILTELFLVRPGRIVPNNIQSLLKNQFINNKEYKNWNLKENICNTIQAKISNFECFCLIVNSYQSINKPNAKAIVFKSERLIELFSNITAHHSPMHEILFMALLRDCRAVYNSQNKTFWPGTNIKMSYSPLRTACFWRNFVMQCLKYSESKNLLLVKYEDLVTRTSEVLCKVTQFIKVESINEGIYSGDLRNRLPENHRSLHKNIDSLPMKNRITAWQSELSKKDIYQIECIAKDYLMEYGYKLLHEQDQLRITLSNRIKLIINKFRKQIKRLKYKLRIIFRGY